MSAPRGRGPSSFTPPFGTGGTSPTGPGTRSKPRNVDKRTRQKQYRTRKGLPRGGTYGRNTPDVQPERRDWEPKGEIRGMNGTHYRVPGDSRVVHSGRPNRPRGSGGRGTSPSHQEPSLDSRFYRSGVGLALKKFFVSHGGTPSGVQVPVSEVHQGPIIKTRHHRSSPGLVTPSGFPRRTLYRRRRLQRKSPVN